MADLPVTEPIVSVKINDGTRRIPFINQDNEEISVLRFRPTDARLIERYTETIRRWPEILSTLDGKEAESENADEPDIAEIAETFQKAQKQLFETMDFLLDGPVSAEIFGKIGPFDPIGENGEMFCEIVIDTMQKLIEQEFAVQLAKRKEREKKMEKYRPPNRAARRAAK